MIIHPLNMKSSWGKRKRRLKNSMKPHISHVSGCHSHHPNQQLYSANALTKSTAKSGFDLSSPSNSSSLCRNSAWQTAYQIHNLCNEHFSPISSVKTLPYMYLIVFTTQCRDILLIPERRFVWMELKAFWLSASMQNCVAKIYSSISIHRRGVMFDDLWL